LYSILLYFIVVPIKFLSDIKVFELKFVLVCLCISFSKSYSIKMRMLNPVVKPPAPQPLASLTEASLSKQSERLAAKLGTKKWSAKDSPKKVSKGKRAIGELSPPAVANRPGTPPAAGADESVEYYQLLLAQVTHERDMAEQKISDAAALEKKTRDKAVKAANKRKAVQAEATTVTSAAKKSAPERRKEIDANIQRVDAQVYRHDNY
jgi:hypothetical protein